MGKIYRRNFEFYEIFGSDAGKKNKNIAEWIRTRRGVMNQIEAITDAPTLPWLEIVNRKCQQVLSVLKTTATHIIAENFVLKQLMKNFALEQ